MRHPVPRVLSRVRKRRTKYLYFVEVWGHLADTEYRVPEYGGKRTVPEEAHVAS